MHLLRPFILGSIRLRATTILIRKHLEQPITYSHYVPTIDICSMHDIYEIFLDILFHYSRKIDKIVLYISKPSKNPHDFLRGLPKKPCRSTRGRGGSKMSKIPFTWFMDVPIECVNYLRRLYIMKKRYLSRRNPNTCKFQSSIDIVT